MRSVTRSNGPFRRQDEVELYVHLPFCANKCRFCFYVSFAAFDGHRIRTYLNALEQEIAFRWVRGKQRINSLYVGGGTPSYLSVREWEHLARVFRKFWSMDEIPEVTVECNPASTDIAKLEAFRAAGVNRISFGVQNIDDRLLAAFGREGIQERLSDLIHNTRLVGLDNINCDVLIGLPGETPDSVALTLGTLADLKIPHISVYPFALRTNSEMFSEDTLRTYCLKAKAEKSERLRYSADYLLSHGYRRISTAHFALDPSYECIHHRNYWDGGNVLGLGLSAQSFIGDTFKRNVSGMADYLRGVPGRTEALSLRLERKDLLRRWALMGLSKKAELTYSALELRFGPESVADLQRELSDVCCSGLAELTTSGVRLTDEGLGHVQSLAALYLSFDNKDYFRRAMRVPEHIQIAT